MVSLTNGASDNLINTRFLILSDTHGRCFKSHQFPKVDVAIHCGDLTDESKLEEFKATIRLLKHIDAPLKLVIAGNHDFTLDNVAFDKLKAEANRAYQGTPDHSSHQGTLDDSLSACFGHIGAARELLLEAQSDRIIYLDEGSHHFNLDNGATLKVYSSPYIPSNGWTWGFQYNSGTHEFDIPRETDLVITHGPPRGIFDRHRDTSNNKAERIGCPQLFQAIAKAQPRLHCFGHVHGDWGARLVTWRSQLTDAPSHFTAINNEMSPVIETLQRLRGTRLEQCRDQNYCDISHYGEHLAEPGKTLFVNASVMGQSHSLDQLPWLVEIGLKPS